MFKWLNAFKRMAAGWMALALSGCGYNTLQTTDEDIKSIRSVLTIVDGRIVHGRAEDL